MLIIKTASISVLNFVILRQSFGVCRLTKDYIAISDRDHISK
jgi:hypothetical protein